MAGTRRIIGNWVVREEVHPTTGPGLPETSAAMELKRRRADRKILWARLEKAVSADHYFYMDIVGQCNLECPSCPVGNYALQIPKGSMSVETYKSILQKISEEHAGERVFIDLYNWAEPTMHKSLALFIELAKNYGFGVGVSSNLNAFPRMRDVIRAKPEYLRISLSGYSNDTYQKTHKGGDINAVKANMYLLRSSMDALGIDIPVQVGFHIYKTNFPNDFLDMERLSDEVGFYFQPYLAAFMPIESAVLAIDGLASPKDQETESRMVLSMRERSELLEPERSNYKNCEFQTKRTALNYDGSVTLCCATFDKAQIIADNFLETSAETLENRRLTNNFCKECSSRNLDMVMTGAGYGRIEEAARQILGPIYSDYLDQIRQ